MITKTFAQDGLIYATDARIIVRTALADVPQLGEATKLPGASTAIGSTVTAMSAAVHGINAGVSRSMAAAGPTTFFITKWPMAINSCTGSADSCPWRRNKPLTLANAVVDRRG